MVEFPNPVHPAVFRTAAIPLVPAWLAGIVLVFALADVNGAASTVSGTDLVVLLAVYSLVVGLLAAVLYAREYRRSPGTVELGFDRVRGIVPGRRPTALEFEYAEILRVQDPGYFPGRLEGFLPGRRTVTWMNLTGENALRVREAWTAWTERAQTGS